MINDRNGKMPEMIKIPDRASFRPRFKRRDIRVMIEEKHQAIADAFGTGIGLKLQRFESDLALQIMIELMNKNVIALPIHDSFIVRRVDKLISALTMHKLYHLKFGFPPVIKNSP